ncbi:MAG: hypothetical protein QF755_00740 [Candidatus Peribacteraceae bacterium]|jgi:hypothetical protein|nr:hypothetical protein [Candidatus Peribacteraceae bacterium]
MKLMQFIRGQIKRSRRIRRFSGFRAPAPAPALAPALALALALTLLIPTQASSVDLYTAISQPPNTDNCRQAVDKLLAREIRLYRAVLFGRQRAKYEPVGTVWFDHFGKAWYKVGKDLWEYVGKEKGDAKTISNSAMEQLHEKDIIPILADGVDFSPNPDDEDAPLYQGIFGTKRVLTSELVPYLAQAMRTLSCRAAMVCEGINLSTGKASKTAKPIVIDIHGCLSLPARSIPACHLDKDKDALQLSDAFQYCSDISSSIIKREAEILKMLVEYDAAYRSLLQFAGTFDEFLLELRWTLVGSIRQSASVIGWMGRIPCFLASCDAYPPPDKVR